VASILRFNRKAGTVFDDRITEIMGEAFDSACKELHDSGQPSIVYEVIARRIIDATGTGERDPVRLRNVGLAALGRQAGGLGGFGCLRLSNSPLPRKRDTTDELFRSGNPVRRPAWGEQKRSHLDRLSGPCAIGTVLQGGAQQVFDEPDWRVRSHERTAARTDI
jgi:hypothetical protein